MSQNPSLSERFALPRSWSQARALVSLLAVLLASTATFADGGSCPQIEPIDACPRIVTADVVALDQPYFFNRLGASQPNGQIFALRSDVVCMQQGRRCTEDNMTPGHVMLDPEKRPRPMVLRVPQGECLRIDFENLLTPHKVSASSIKFKNEYDINSKVPPTATRQAGVHVMGLSLVAACDGDQPAPAIDADASFVGANENGLIGPGERRTYIYKADQEGAYLLQSTGAMAGLLDGNGQTALGLHGMVNVQPPGAVFFRSQVTREDLLAANRRDDCPYPLTPTDDGDLCLTPRGQPLIDYWAKNENGRPILAMIDPDPDSDPTTNEAELVGSDLTAIIAYQDEHRSQPGEFPFDPEDPLCFPVPAATGDAPLETRCTRPFREITTIYQEPLASTAQTLPCVTSGAQTAVGELGDWENLGTTTITLPVSEDDSNGSVTASQTPCPTSWNVTPYLTDIFSANGSIDSFSINFGMDAIGPRVLANRVRIGPQGDCVGCKYEEFFLSSWPNGDPAQVSTQPPGLSDSSDDSADTNGEAIRFPDDPSNVYHSYLGDPVKYRIASAGGAAAHVHHQHAHQWLHTPNASAGHYLDSQTLTPGSTYTLEMVYSGSGNRNETVGDSIFHCHFYPHFASGMWALWRVHDVFEEGTRMDPETGRPADAWQCELDGQISDGSECRQAEQDGQPVRWQLVEPNRALPDPTIAEGSPIPALVPLPGLAMPPMPAPVALSPDGKRGLTLVRQTEGSWSVLGSEPSLADLLDAESTQMLNADLEITAELAEKVGNPGFPFFIPGLAGQRAVRPPLDVPTIDHDGEELALDGGLPRHRIGASPPPAVLTDSTQADGCTPAADGNPFRECHTRHDFSKILLDVDAEQLDTDGEPAEQLAMWWHGDLFPGGRIPSCGTDGICDAETSFRLNGSRPAAGAPYADPCALEDRWNGETRHYKAAAIQTDVVFTKEGWHFPQQRMLSLWEDVKPTLEGARTPEPLFFRAASGECIDFWHANLVPSEYALDDYQVRTPTDIIGQHIHLVKFDVTSSDGAANGFNYEDATFSPDEVRERIDAINAGGGLRVRPGETCPDGQAPDALSRCRLEAKELPFFGSGPGGRWIGAMATVQRWMADPLEDVYGNDRTLRTVFTHDHMSPSTHQQAGLYAGLLVEPKCSQWVDSWTGEVMGGSLDPLGDNCESVYAARPSDGGPTSWRANILYREDDASTSTQPASYEPGHPTPRLTGVREFALEFQDIALTYPRQTQTPPSTLALEQICPSCPGPSQGAGVGPSSVANKFNYGVDFPRAANSPGITAPTGPWPQAVTFGAMLGIYSINYRSEPLAPRVTGADGSPPPATGERLPAQDYAQVYRSIERLNPALNKQPDWYPPLTGGVQGTDPITPLLEAYAGDPIQIRTLTGAHFLNHQFSLRGLPWLFEPSLANSGYRAAQSTSLSEHFELNIQLPREIGGPQVDYLYQTDLSDQAQAKGAWGLLRSYADRQDFLEPLPNNVPSQKLPGTARAEVPGSFRTAAEVQATEVPGSFRADGSWVCSPDSLTGRNGFKTRRYRVLALSASDFASDVPLPYRSPMDLVLQTTDEDGNTETLSWETAIESPEAVIYALAEDLVATDEGWRWADHRQAEPLVLRAAAGDCLEVTLENHLDPTATPFVTDNPTNMALEAPLTGSADCTDAVYLQRLAQVQDGSDPDALDGYAELCAGSFAASTRVGLSPQLVAYDPLHSAGYDAGFNPVQTVPARSPEDLSPEDLSSEDLDASVPSRTYFWYAGHVQTDDEGRHTYTPVEFGAANLLPADPLFQATKGLFGALIIEPEGAHWVEDAQTRLQATVYPTKEEPFREGVLLLQDDLELYFRDSDGQYQALNVQNVGNFSGQLTAVGYGTETPLMRMAPPAANDIVVSGDQQDPGDPQPYGTFQISDFVDQSCWLSSAQAGRDPSTTMLVAHAGTPYRIRLLHTLGNFTPQTFELHGHGWQEEPYVPLSGPANVAGFTGPGPVPQTLGDNPYSQWMGSQGGIGAGQHFDVVLAPVGDGTSRARHNGAGGQLKVPGDYLYRTWQSNGFIGGTWGLFRVGPQVPAGERRDIVAVLRAIQDESGETTIIGSNSSILGSKPGEPRFSKRLSIHAEQDEDPQHGPCSGEPIAVVEPPSPVGPTLTWNWTGDTGDATRLCVVSEAGGLDRSPIVDDIPCPAATNGAPQSSDTASAERIRRMGGQG